MTSKQEIGLWFDQGVEQGSDFMIIVCDTFDYGDYPVYATKDDYPTTIKRFIPSQNMQRVMEIYNLSIDKDEQLDEQRVQNAPTSNN